MYTTLSLLKATKACVPGYTRMIGFFGTSAKVKEVKIPLYAVSLIGGHEDCTWAIENGMIIDKTEYDKFYRHHLAAMIQFKFWLEHEEHRDQNWEMKHDYAKQARLDIMKVVDYESAQAWLDARRAVHINHWIWENMLADKIWSSPGKFVAAVVEHHQTRHTALHTCALLKPDSAETPSSHQRRQLMNGTVSEKRGYYFDFPRDKAINHQMAFLMNCGQDPYPSMVEMMASNGLTSTSKGKGMMLSQADDKDPPGYHLTVNVSNPELIFRVFHLMNAMNLDLNEMVGINAGAETVSQHLGALGIGRTSQSFDSPELVAAVAANPEWADVTARAGRPAVIAATSRDDEDGDDDEDEDDDREERDNF
jgi:hypothetical protein